MELVTFGNVASAAMLSSGCGALELRKKKERESRWWCGEREREQRWRETFDFAKRKKVFRRGFENFQGHICLFRCIRYGVLTSYLRQVSLFCWA